MVTLRRAGPDDAATVAEVYLDGRAAAGAAIPPSVHPPDDVRRWVREVMLPSHEVWLAVDDDGTAVGLLALDGDPSGPSDLAMLYVVGGAWGRGIGSALLDRAVARRPAGLALWAFASNTRARRFYERHGFRAVRTTDGDNEEGAPDVRYVRGRHPEGAGPVASSGATPDDVL